MENEILTPAALWKDYDPEAEPLETNVVKEEEENGILFKQVYFTGEFFGTGKSRVFAVTARKVGTEKLPGIVFVTGPERSVDYDRLRFWAICGYAAICVDNYGEGGAKLFTQYPPEIDYANFCRAGRHLTNADTSVKESSWFQWAKNIRRALTFFAAEDYVDEQNVGIVSIFNGSFLLSQVLAFDSRLKAGAALYSACCIEREELDLVEETEDLNVLNERIRCAEERERWLLGVSPQSYVMYFKVPLYVALTTNAVVNRFDQAVKVLGKSEKVRFYIEPRVAAPDARKQMPNVKWWMDCWLKGKKPVYDAPKAEWSVENGNLYFNVTLPENCKKGEVYYARETENLSCRNWEEAPFTKTETGWRAKLAVANPEKPVYAFCNAEFENGIVISGDYSSVVPAKLGEVKKLIPTKLLYNSSEGLKDFTSADPTSCEMDLTVEKPLRISDGPFGVKGVTGKKIGTFQLNDEKYLTQEDTLLMADVYSSTAQKLIVLAQIDRGAIEQKLFTATVDLLGGQMWQKVILSPADFKDGSKTLKDWKVNLLSFQADEEFSLNNLLFT